MDSRPLDLTSVAVTQRLLARPQAWRERAVEQLSIGSAEFVQRERSLQCRPLLPLVADLAPGATPADTAYLVLPLAPLPKRPLLDLHLRGPLGPLTLLRRPDIAQREAALVHAYALEAELPVPPLVGQILPALLEFTEGSWAAVLQDTSEQREVEALYLSQGLVQTVTDAQLQRLRAAGVAAVRALDPYVELPVDEVSALEAPLLVLPPLLGQGVVASVGEGVLAIEQYSAWLEDLAGADPDGEPGAARDLLFVLADYGRQWDLMVLGEFPLNRPFVVHYKHLEPSPVRGWRATITPAVVVADADSNHITLRSTDPGTRLVAVQGKHPRTGAIAHMGSTSLGTDELHSFYVWEVDVDYRVVLEAQLAVLRRTAAGIVTLAGLVVLVCLALAVRAPRSIPELALMAGPAGAVAGSLLLREPSTLASRLRFPYTIATTVALVLLASVTVWRFLTPP